MSDTARLPSEADYAAARRFWGYDSGSGELTAKMFFGEKADQDVQELAEAFADHAAALEAENEALRAALEACLAADCPPMTEPDDRCESPAHQQTRAALDKGEA